MHKGGTDEDSCVRGGLSGGCADSSKEAGSHAVGVLKNGGFLTVDEDGYLNLTNAGREVAEKIYERHQFFTEQLVAVGVDRETAERDACRIEHVISEEAFEKLKTSVEKKY